MDVMEFLLEKLKEKNRHIEVMTKLMNTQKQIELYKSGKADYIQNDLSGFKGKPNSKPIIFISHDSRYKKLKNRLAQRLEEAGFSIWQDVPKRSKTLNELLEDGIRDSKYIILLIYKPSVLGRTDGGFPIELELIYEYLDRVHNHPEGRKQLYICYNGGDDDVSIMKHLKKGKTKNDPMVVRRMKFIMENKTLAFHNLSDDFDSQTDGLIKAIKDCESQNIKFWHWTI